MKFSEFEALARQEWDDIPPEFKGGVDALVVEREAKAHPSRAGIYTLGECLTETWPSDYGSAETIRSAVVLYYGSFRRLADGEPDFDWTGEIWETLTHELRHHLESLAADAHLEDLDAAVEENFRRADGEAFDPFFFRLGERLGDGWYQLEDAFFLEVDATDRDCVEFTWNGVRYHVDLPHFDEDVVFLDIESGVDDPPSELCLVLLRQRRLRARVRAVLKGGWKVAEAVAAAQRA